MVFQGHSTELTLINVLYVITSNLVNFVLLTIGGSCVCIEDTRADLFDG